MSKEDIETEIKNLEDRLEYLLRRGANDEFLVDKLREFRNKLKK